MIKEKHKLMLLPGLYVIYNSSSHRTEFLKSFDFQTELYEWTNERELIDKKLFDNGKYYTQSWDEAREETLLKEATVYPSITEAQRVLDRIEYFVNIRKEIKAKQREADQSRGYYNLNSGGGYIGIAELIINEKNFVGVNALNEYHITLT